MTARDQRIAALLQPYNFDLTDVEPFEMTKLSVCFNNGTERQKEDCVNAWKKILEDRGNYVIVSNLVPFGRPAHPDLESLHQGIVVRVGDNLMALPHAVRPGNRVLVILTGTVPIVDQGNRVYLVKDILSVF